MRKTFIIIIMSLLVLTALGELVSSAEEKYESEKTSTSFTKPVIIEENEFITLEIEEANGFLMKQDKPILPSYTQIFTYPLGTEIININCLPNNIQQIQISKQIEPTPVAIPIGLLTKTVEQRATYNLNEPYPETWFEYNVGCGIVDNERCIILKIQIFPVKYNQAEGYIQWVNEVMVDIDYKTNPKIFNYEDNYEFLILTPNNYKNELLPLESHKINRGISTKIITLDEIYDSTFFNAEGRDDPEKVKYFIKNAIENWATTDVLLVGGIDDFPARETHINVSDDDREIFVSDLYYADVYDEELNFLTWDTNENSIFAEFEWEGQTDDIDFYPDIKLGRITCINPQQVTTIVNKIIKYENNKAYTQNWFNNIVVIGGDTFPKPYGDNSGIDEGEYVNQAVIDIMQGFIPDKIWDTNNRLSGISPNGLQNIESGIENGCGFLEFSGHGAPWIWTTFPHDGERQSLPTPTGRYTNEIIMDLNNGDMLPIVMNGGCSLGKYADNDNCNAWAFLANPNGGGIASFGATGLGWVYTGKGVTTGLVEGYMVDLFNAYMNGAITFGEMYADALNEYIYTNMNSYDYKTLMEMQPFGDPTLAIAEESTPPEKPNRPVGPTSGKIDEPQEYTSTATDIDGDEIYYLFDWGDETVSGWIGPYKSGEEGKATQIYEKQGDFQIRVKAKDEHGKMSDWSEPLSVSMLKVKYIQFPYLYKLLERFPILKLILNL